jgi:hypothetical protein
MLDPALPRLLRLDPAAKLVAPDLTGRALREELRAKGLPVVKVRNRMYVEQSTLEALLESCREKPSLPAYTSASDPGETRDGSSATAAPRSTPIAAKTNSLKRRRTSPGSCRCVQPIRAPMGEGRFQCLACSGTIEKRGFRG